MLAGFDYTEYLASEQMQGKHADEIQSEIEVLLSGVYPAKGVQSQQAFGAHHAASRSITMLTSQFGKQNSDKTNSKGGDCSVKSLKYNICQLQVLTNVFCLALTQARDRETTGKYLLHLENLFKYAVSLSSLWKPSKNLVDPAIATKLQSRIAESCAFVLVFVFQEIHQSNNGRSTPTAVGVPNTIDELSSPKSYNTTKQYQHCLKQCLVFLVSLVESELNTPEPEES